MARVLRRWLGLMACLMAISVMAGSTATASSPADRPVREVRVVAIDDRFDLADYASYSTFQAEMQRHAGRAPGFLRGRRSTRVEHAIAGRTA